MKAIIFITLLVLGTFVSVNSLTETEVVSFLEGALAGMANQVAGLDQCVSGVETIGLDIDQAVQSFEQEDEPGVSSGLSSIGSALQALPAAMQECKATYSSIQSVISMVKSFTSPMSFAYHVGKDILVNGKNIYSEITTAVNDYESGNLYDMGVQCGTALYQIFLGAQMTENIQLTTTEKDIVAFFEGFGEAIAVQIPNLENCIQDVVGAGQALFTAVQDFEQETEDGIKLGLTSVGTALNQLPAALRACEASVDSIKSVGQMLGVYNSFWSFAYHVGKEIIVNGKNIYSEVSSAVADYNNAQYLNMGYEIGTAVYQIFIQSSQEQTTQFFQLTTTEKDVIGFFEGVLEGLAVNIPGVEQCVASVVSVGVEIDQAFKNFEQKDESGIRSGLRSIGLIVQQIPNDLTECKASAASMLNIVKMAKSFTNIWSFTYHVGKDLIVNGAQIYGEINTAIGDYKTRQYQAAGVQVGNALFKIFVQSTTNLRSAQ